MTKVYLVEGCDDDGGTQALLLFSDKDHADFALAMLRISQETYGPLHRNSEFIAAKERGDDGAMFAFFPPLAPLAPFATYATDPWHSFDALMGYDWHLSEMEMY